MIEDIWTSSVFTKFVGKDYFPQIYWLYVQSDTESQFDQATFRDEYVYDLISKLEDKQQSEKNEEIEESLWISLHSSRQTH